MPLFSSLLEKGARAHTAPSKHKEPSQAHIPVRVRRTQIVEIDFQDGHSDICAAVFAKAQDGTPVCAILHDGGKKPGFWRALPYVASDLAKKQPCETVKWVLVSFVCKPRGEFSFDVWEATLSRDSDGLLRASWTEARPEYATEWIRRAAEATHSGSRTRMRPSTGSDRVGTA